MPTRPAPLLRFHALGNWGPAQVSVTRITAGRRTIVPHVEALIDAAWRDALARPGVRLFDGPMCRMESWEASPEQLRLVLSPTSYKPFLGTNLSNPALADRYGRDVLANPVGVSPALTTADGWLMMGRRNATVAYYPDRVHPFAGALDPTDPDVFAAIARELEEELGFSAADLQPDGIRCTGVAEDVAIRQPELIFWARSTRSRAQIEAMLDDAEHLDSWAAPASPDGIESALESGEAFTPVAVAAMLLLGRIRFGEEWFATMRPRFAPP